MNVFPKTQTITDIFYFP